MDIRSLLQTHWDLSPSQVVPITEGLINQTWLVRTAAADYILQQINTEVFKEPAVLQQQLVDLSASIQLPSLVPLDYCLISKGAALTQVEGKTFRLLKAISPSTTLQTATVQNARLAALALLEFQAALGSVSVEEWKSPIPQFLEVEFRLTSFGKAKLLAREPRKEKAAALMSTLEADWAALLAWKQLSDEAEPVLIHADPKLGNFLFHPNGKQVRALIDWDTIQLGSPYYDYGDMIRSFCSHGEDAAEHAQLFKEEIFEVLVAAFAVDESKLYTAARGVILVQALRFLTDYLQDDRYYKVKDEEHNLRRTANQLRLASELKNYWLTTRRPTH
jgi:aminoglycoside phosphotransferase (APT) family kinase protein